MKKVISLIVIGISLMACNNGPFSDDSEATGRCYVRAARYLMGKSQVLTQTDFQKYPYEGNVQDVFREENDNEALELYYDFYKNFTDEELYKYQDDGYRLVVRYQTGENTHHARELFYHEVIPPLTSVIYVAGYFQ